MKPIYKNSALVFCALALTTAPALAGGMYRHQSVVVSYGDLDVSHSAGAQALLYRLDRAASRICGNVPDNRDLGRTTLYNSCKRAAVGAAVSRIGHPQLFKVYGRPLPRLASE